MDVELSRYRRVVETLPPGVSREGLEIAASDLSLMLLRSLPRECQSYVVLHSTGESYAEQRTLALRFESQQRIFQELNGPTTAKLREMYALEGWYEEGEGGEKVEEMDGNHWQ